MKYDDIEKIAVLGAGVMGHGIAQVAAMAGFQVTLRDIASEYLESGKKGIESSLGKLVERGRLTEEESQGTIQRIKYTVDLGEAVGDADLVIEAIPEKMELKKKVWRDVESKAPKDSILASNTSSLSITEISKAVSSPERFIGMHFFNPPAIMKLVEVNQGEKTSAETVQIVIKIAEKMGKTPVWVKKDSPGFIVNRILVSYLNEAAKLLSDYSQEQIDAAMQHVAGMPLGPFMLADLIGIDVVYPILREFEENLGEKYQPDKHFKALYEQGKLGRKTGEGFYSYETRPRVTEDQAEGFDVKLLLVPFVEEAEKVVAEGLAGEEEVDTAMKLGANLPEGPFEMKRKGLGAQEPVLTEKKDRVYTITINRPNKLNSITLDMLKMVDEAIDDAWGDPDVRCLVFKGAGDRAFCSGADIAGFLEMDSEKALTVPETGHRVFKKLLEIPKPVVAAVNGYCLGGGNELILYCDFRLASEKSQFGQPEVNLGLIPGWGGNYLLPKIVGYTLGKEMLMTGRRINATEAKAAGLLNEVYPEEVFKEKVSEFTSQLVDGPPRSHWYIKKISNLDPGLEQALDHEKELFADLWNYGDLREGLLAFMERRKPEFKGK
jgi:enoyl-CoA hydratase/3-hydroxyacyl-CoA dehydrogenase